MPAVARPRRGDGRRGLRGIDDPEASGFRSRARAIGLAHAFEELVAFAFDAIRAIPRAFQVTAAGAFAALRDTNIEQQGERRLQADHPAFEFGDEFHIEPAPTALVGVAGIGEAVADHPRAALEDRKSVV